MAGDAPCAMPSTSNDRRSYWVVGGDLPMDVLATGIEEADRQYDLWDEAVAGVTQDIRVALGNHDILGIADESPLDKSHPMYGKK